MALHSTYKNAQELGAETLVAFDVYRVKDGQVSEHWDTLQPLVSETISGHTMVDGVTEVCDLSATEANRAMIRNFVRDVLAGENLARITDYITSEPYPQHNPMIGDGLEALVGAFQAMAANGQGAVYTETPLVIAEGDFVLTGSEGLIGETQSASFFDLFRIKDGLIVEHWDTIAPIPSDMPHANGKF